MDPTTLCRPSQKLLGFRLKPLLNRGGNLSLDRGGNLLLIPGGDPLQHACTPLNDHDIFNNILELRPTNSNYQDLQESFAEHL